MCTFQLAITFICCLQIFHTILSRWTKYLQLYVHILNLNTYTAYVQTSASSQKKTVAGFFFRGKNHIFHFISPRIKMQELKNRNSRNCSFGKNAIYVLVLKVCYSVITSRKSGQHPSSPLTKQLHQYVFPSSN